MPKGFSIMRILRYLYVVLGFVTASAFSSEHRDLGLAKIKHINNQRVIYLNGSPFERGYQHGFLLKTDIHKNIQDFLRNPKLLEHPRFKNFRNHIASISKYIPQSIIEELKGLAFGADVLFEDILLLNLFPEMFHCSGISVANEATYDGSLYHVRVLDYRVGQGLQHTAAIMICTPDNANAYVSVSYAGFIGCITGMNNKQISIGEVGGNGYPYLEGVPMAFLMKLALENCSTLNEVATLYENTPRTGEYYYIFADGKTSSSVSVYATNSQINFITPGSSYALLAPDNAPANFCKDGIDDKFFLKDYQLNHGSFHCVLKNSNGKSIGMFFSQLKDTLTLIGFAAPDRYDPIVEGIKERYGKIDQDGLIEILRKPKASHNSNLHTAIFHPSSLSFWVAHASKDDQPAYTQNFSCFNLESLLE